MANQRDNIVNMQAKFDEKAEKMRNRNEEIIGGKLSNIMNLLDTAQMDEEASQLLQQFLLCQKKSLLCFLMFSQKNLKEL